MNSRTQIFLLSAASALVLITSGCASFRPQMMGAVPFLERAQTQVEGNIRVTAAVPSAEETEALFDAPLYEKGVQPVWLEIENGGEEPVFFLPVGLDKDYFSPLEVAYLFHPSFSKKAEEEMDLHFDEQAIDKYIPPGTIQSGYVYTNLDLGTKGFNVDLIERDSQLRTFTFFINVPGLRADHRDVDFSNLYGMMELVDYDEQDFRSALEHLSCCTADEKGTSKGEPLNIVIVGEGKDVLYSLIRSGWNETGILEKKQGLEALLPPKLPGGYRYEPVSPQYFHGRPQDAAFRKKRDTAQERNQLRLWLAPMTVEGKLVWIGQISREVRVRTEKEVYEIEPGAIAASAPRAFRSEPDVDGSRHYLIQNLWYSQSLVKYGFVKGAEAVPLTEPRISFTGAPYFTDGFRAVLWVSRDPVTMTEMEFLDWEHPFLGRE